MTLYKISSSCLQGSITLPSSKSHTLRSLLFSLMAPGKSQIDHALPSPDTEAMIEAIKIFGAQVKREGCTLFVEGVGSILPPAEDVIQSGNSGLVLRLMTALASLSPAYTVITGDFSIRHRRPIQPLLQALSQLGAVATSSRLDGHAPVIIKGPIRSGNASLEGQDSQLVSSLLFASSFAEGPIEIEVSNPGETPWIELSLHWLRRLNLPYEREGYAFYKIPGGHTIKPFYYAVPGDFSSAAYPIISALITHSEITVHHVDLEDIQGDKMLINTLQEMGALFEINPTEKTLKVLKNSFLKGARIDLNQFIDALPILAVLGCFAEGETLLYNGAIARHKECDRIRCITTELKKMGAKIEEKTDGVVIKTSQLKGAHVHTYHDHRMVLSLAVAAMQAQGVTHIHDIHCVSKTYPSFLQDMQSLGVKIQECI
jgi:3-phosphoshikimate 1-carboxyvinyltransferase